MTIMTEKDKKLLIFAGAFVGIVLLAGLVIYPLWGSTKKLETEITEQELLKQENELKVAQVQVLKNSEKEMDETLAALSGRYFEPMRSVEVDRLMTGIALENGVKAESLTISMPENEEFFSLKSYRDIVYQPEEAGEPEPFEGVYSISVLMSLNGQRESLQRILDQIVASQPKMRLVSYAWSDSTTAGSSPCTLDMTVELYMCVDVDAYIAEQMEAAALQETADAAQQEDTN